MYNNKLNTILTIIALSTSQHCLAADNLNNYYNDYQIYQSKDKNTLATLAKAQPNDLVVNYLNALANLNESNYNLTINYITQDTKNPLAISLAHKALTNAYNNKNWLIYSQIYNMIESKQVNQNEQCGNWLSNYMTEQATPPKNELEAIINSKMNDRCLSLVATLTNNNALDKKYIIPTLYNLIINNQISQYNQIANTLNIANYQLNSQHPQTKYDIVYTISQLAKTAPDTAFYQLENTSTDSFTKQYLYNYLANKLAYKQMFQLALQATSKGHSKYLTNDQYEWKTRIYLTNQKWLNVIETINHMPNSLKTTDKWLYWKAYAENKLGNKKQAKLILKSINLKPNFYSLLANSELGNNYTIPPKINVTNNIDQIKFAQYAKLGFDLYNTGKQYNISYYKNLGTYVLYRTIDYSNDNDKAVISDEAYKYDINDSAIYAAIKMNQVDINRAFPLLYLDSYQQASAENNLPITIPLAITRQESRFNRTVIAFDGGVGLMQLMPATANHIAKKLNLSADCYKTSYQCNIREGTWFIAQLYKKFGNNLIYASSGYNAGPGRANRWEKAFYGLDNQLQMELIPFDITRTYAQHIITNQLVYDGLINQKPLNMTSYLKNINNKDSTYLIDDNTMSNDNADNADNQNSNNLNDD